MTRKEAINMCMEVRHYLTQGNPIWDKNKVGEALDMAIEALQADKQRGEWNWMADCGVTECNQCGWSIAEYVGDYNFCPNCGSDNRERSEE